MAIMKILDQEDWVVTLSGPPRERESHLNPEKMDHMYQCDHGYKLPDRDHPDEGPTQEALDYILFASQYLHEKIQQVRADMPYPVTVQIGRFTGDNGFTKWTVKLAQASPGASAPTGGIRLLRPSPRSGRLRPPLRT